MNQPDLFGQFESPEARILRENPGLFRSDFPDWLERNPHIWVAFQREADTMRRKGRTHYSARTIIHFLRHESALAEVGGEWKINNNCSPDLARLYMRLRGCPEFFETRLQEESERAA